MSEEATIREFQNLRDQLEEKIFEAVIGFDDLTGVQVDGIKISRERKIGFDSVDTMTIEVITNI